MGDDTNTEAVIERRRVRSATVAAFFLPIVLLLPFAGKAYHIDDPMFVWVAQQIAAEPLDYFGGEMDLGTFRMPMYQFNQNPPGFSYLLALVGAIFGWGEFSMHIVPIIAAGLASLGVYRLAARLCERPFVVAAATVLTPAFLVSASTVMTDVAMVAAYVWGIYFWIRGLDANSNRLLFASAAIIAAGTLLKYFAITAVPLLLVYTLTRRRKPGLWIVALATPVAAAAAFLLSAYYQYGVNLLQIAADTAQLDRVRRDDGAWARVVITLGFLGGSAIPVALYALLVLRKRMISAVSVAVVVLSLPATGGYSFLQLGIGEPEPYGGVVLIHLAVMLALGLLLLIACGASIREKLNPEGLLLALWILGTLVFVVRVNHYINARVILPLVPAVAILIMRKIDAREGPPSARRVPAWPLAVGALVSLCVTLGDYTVANNQRAAAEGMVATAQREDVQLHYAGVGGFVYYLEEGGAKALDVESGGFSGEHKVKMLNGDLLAVDAGARDTWKTPPRNMEEVEVYVYTFTYWASTIHAVGQAGFYAHLVGILPYRLGPVSSLEFGLYRWTGLSYGSNDGPAVPA